MNFLKYFLLSNWAVVFCYGWEWGGDNTDNSGKKTITEPFAFQTWSDFVTNSKNSSKELIKNPVSYSKKSATIVEINLEPLRMSKIDHDENVSSELERDD